MTKPVTLSDAAFAALRAEKRPGESDSGTVLRLMSEAHGARRDPARVPWGALVRAVPPDRHRAMIHESDEADRSRRMG